MFSLLPALRNFTHLGSCYHGGKLREQSSKVRVHSVPGKCAQICTLGPCGDTSPCLHWIALQSHFIIIFAQSRDVQNIQVYKYIWQIHFGFLLYPGPDAFLQICYKIHFLWYCYTTNMNFLLVSFQNRCFPRRYLLIFCQIRPWRNKYTGGRSDIKEGPVTHTCVC